MSIGNDGNWVNANRELDDSNYMSIAEWCAWTIRVAAELLDKGASDQLNALRKNVQLMSYSEGGTKDLLASFNQSLVDKGKITEEEHEAALGEIESEGVDAMIGFAASGEAIVTSVPEDEEIRDPLSHVEEGEYVEPTEEEVEKALSRTIPGGEDDEENV